MPEIACGHCGATHASVQEVRSCSRQPANRGAEPGDAGPSSAPVSVPPDPSVPVHRGDRGPAARRGPAELGRTLAVPDDLDIPAGWDDAPVFDLTGTVSDDSGHPEDQEHLAELVDRLQRRWRAREPYVVRFPAHLSRWPRSIIRREFWQIPPELDLVEEQLHHLIWSNALLAHPDGSLSFPAAAAALQLGAVAAGDAKPNPNSTPNSTLLFDLKLPDGTGVVIDGGPLDFSLTERIGIPVVHTVSLESGRRTPLGAESLTTEASELAADQLAAVTHCGGAARIIAPAGSGKTRVLTERARHLVRDVRLPPQTLTLVAYNKRAQLEMEQRTSDLAGLRVRTLNSLALAILNGSDGFARPATGARRFQTIAEPQVRKLLSEAMNGLVKVRRRRNTDQMAAWIEAISAARLSLRDPDHVAAAMGPDVARLADVLKRYRTMLADQGLLDFDEQILRAIETLLTDPEARRQAHRTCRLLLVDEFQDLTPAHLLLIRLLAGPRGDVFGVGDDDQTIYGYNGATPRWLMNYDRYFPGAELLALEVNYRCSPEVVRATTRLLARNHERVDKTVRTPTERPGNPHSLRIITNPNPLASLVGEVRGLLEQGVQPGDIIILARVNVGLAAPQIALGSAGLPVVHTTGTELLQRTGVRTLLGWLRMAVAPRKLGEHDISAAVRRPSRRLSPRVMDWMSEKRNVGELRQLARRLREQPQEHSVMQFCDDIETLAKLAGDGAATAELMAEVRDYLGLGRDLNQLDNSRSLVTRSTHSDDLTALAQLADLHPDPNGFSDWLEDRLGRPGAAEGAGVGLSTVHRVKGLEWPHVIVVGVDQDAFPHRLAELAEERRVFHVAITRSSLSTTVIADSTRPSRFVKELTEDPPPRVAVDPADTKLPPASPEVAAKSTPSIKDEALSQADQALFENLRKWRLATARGEGVPAFVVCHDRMLKAVARTRPRTPEELLEINGIGPVKLERYGETLLAEIADFVDPTVDPTAGPRSNRPAVAAGDILLNYNTLN